MSAEENIRAVEGLFEAINSQNLDQGLEYQTEDYIQEAPGAPGPLNREQAQMYTQGFLNAFPDLNFKVEQIITQGDQAAVRWVGSGTHQGPLLTPTGDTIPATGKHAVVPGCTIYEFKNGKAARAWIYWDMVTLLSQLGLMPGV